MCVCVSVWGGGGVADDGGNAGAPWAGGGAGGYTMADCDSSWTCNSL